MGQAAAFFDLDRTLLAGASGPIVSEALREVGVMPANKIPGEGLLFGIFDLIGETRPSMMLAKQGVKLSAGWDAAAVNRAGALAAQRLVPQIQPFGLQLLEEHRSAGRLVVMATTSPASVCEPLGDLLGLDGVISTHYGDDDGVYNGTVDGHYVWGKGKRAAVEEWAEEHDVDLAESYAYSDSYYDQPMLSAVGHPVVVNPDPRMRVVATVKGWPVRYLDVPRGVPKVGGVEPQQAVLAMVQPELIPYARFEFTGVDHLPDDGGCIIAANHRSYFDIVAIGLVMQELGRPARFLAKKELFDAPVVGQLVRAMGAIEVDRGSGSSNPLDQAVEALEGGEVVVILPEGTIPRGEEFFNPKLVGRTGVARLARESGADVYPLGLWGTENVWPRNSKVPLMWNVLDAPTVEVAVGGPVELKRSSRSDNADTKRVMTAITGLLPAEARKRRKPTEAELARTFPS